MTGARFMGGLTAFFALLLVAAALAACEPVRPVEQDRPASCPHKVRKPAWSEEVNGRWVYHRASWVCPKKGEER